MKFKKLKKMLDNDASVMIDAYLRDGTHVYKDGISIRDLKDDYDDLFVKEKSVSIKGDSPSIKVDLKAFKEDLTEKGKKKKKKKATASDDSVDAGIDTMKRRLESLSKERKEEKKKEEAAAAIVEKRSNNSNSKNRNRDNDSKGRKSGAGAQKANDILKKFADETIQEATTDVDSSSIEEKITNTIDD